MWFFSRKDEIFTEERMIRAVEFNDISFMKDYIKNDYDVSFETYDESYPNLLFYATTAEAVNLLAEAGIDVNARAKFEKNQNTPLHNAVLRDNQEVIQALVNNGADVNILNAKHVTPFLLALQLHHLTGVHLMMSHNPDFQVTDSHQNTALHYLTLWENERETKELLALRLEFIAKGADVRAQNVDGKTAQQLMKPKSDVNNIHPENISHLILSHHSLKNLKKVNNVHTME